MLLAYRVHHRWFFDLAGYGKEGKIEGMERDELLKVCLDVYPELDNGELQLLSDTLNKAVLERGKLCSTK